MFTGAVNFSYAPRCITWRPKSAPSASHTHDDGRVRDAFADRVDEGEPFLWTLHANTRRPGACWGPRVALHAGGPQVHEQHIAILLEIGMIALEVITAARRKSDEEMLVHLLDERRIAAHQANAYASFISGYVLGLSSCGTSLA
ncbi:MAG: hypothetical protein DMG32_19645 [Acidobacteria bacterium]|nr:MAG: hypothetical protein DMG32_19645 [Acidobacteriota bacterium]